MLSASQQKKLSELDCDVRFDNLTRRLYATDASIYQIEPAAVAFPANVHQAGAVIRTAADAGVALIPRGAGTGLTGGAIGSGLVVEFSRYNRQISELNLEARTVRVGAGVVLDQLNAVLRPHGFRFGPDVATSSRATLGGMIANNSSGAHTPFYGTTADHIEDVELILADGSIETIGPGHDTLPSQRKLVARLICDHAREINRRMPPGLFKRQPGYALDRCLREPENLAHLLAGSEGTLAAIMSAKLRIVPLPREQGVGLIFFASIAEAMQATVELLDLNPAAIEHIDRVLFDQTKGQIAFQGARDLLELDAQPCEAILVVEFFEGSAARLEELVRRKLGLRTTVLNSAAEINLVWDMRKAGLSLLTGCKGDAKPVTCIEDTAVLPQKLPEYVAGLQQIFTRLGLQGSFYGHAASGLLHVRPVLDLHRAEHVRRLRQVSDEVSALVQQFNGSLAGEHGVGIARTEYLAAHLGSELLEVMRQIKAAFDPKNRFNPGKILDDGRFRIDTQLRLGAGYKLPLPFEPMLAFAAKDGSFAANLEQCNGCGGCRKDTPTMCPTFIVTGEEIMSTRGRANAIRAALELRGIEDGDPLRSAELEAALSHCLSCKACTTECPSNVNLSLLKAELLHARWQHEGLPLSVRLFSSVDWLGRLGCAMPSPANAALQWRWVRRFMSRALGIAEKRPLPPYSSERFDRWFARRPKAQDKPRGRVILWDDTFVRYHDPHIGRAAVKVLEAAGFDVVLAQSRKCCGRPAFSQGHLTEAKRLGAHNLQLLAGSGAPIIFLEPSCYSMFVEDYRELNLPGAKDVGARCLLFEEFIEELLEREPDALAFKPGTELVAIHAHCHAKSLRHPGYMKRLAERLPGRNARLLESGCCGMAGAFGALESKYELSLKVAAPLVDKINRQPEGTVLVASGTSCRHQIEHLTFWKPRHMAELLADAQYGAKNSREGFANT